MPEVVTSLNPLRKAAILISALDDASADKLLDQMSEAQARLVRDQILALDEIDPEVQKEVLQEFFAAQQPGTATTHEAEPETTTAKVKGVELDLSPQREPTTETYTAGWASRDGNLNPFGFLSELDSQVLSEALLREHPQTMAVVLAHLPPRRAAAVLEQLPAPQQAEVARRIVDLDEMDTTVIEELAASFAQQLDDQLRKQRRRVTGMNRLAGILAESRQTSEQQILQNLAQYQHDLSAGLQQVRSPAKPVTVAPPQSPSAEQAEILSFTIPVRTDNLDRVLALPDKQLLAVLQQAETEQVVLALAGVEPQVVERIGRNLPLGQAKLLQRALLEIGPVRHEQATAAQQELTRVAASLGYLKLTARRRQAA
jgi:flagellar motor switch protein FliG